MDNETKNQLKHLSESLDTITGMIDNAFRELNLDLNNEPILLAYNIISDYKKSLLMDALILSDFLLQLEVTSTNNMLYALCLEYSKEKVQ